MAGEGDPPPSDEVRLLIADVIRAWQAKGTRPLVKPHHFFTGSACPGPDPPQVGRLQAAPVEGQAEGRGGRAEARDAGLAHRPRPLAARRSAAAKARRARTEAGASDRLGGRRAHRPDGQRDRAARVVPRLGAVAQERREEERAPSQRPREVPDSWGDGFKRLDQIFSGEAPKPSPSRNPEPEPTPEPRSGRGSRRSPSSRRAARDAGTSSRPSCSRATTAAYTDANVRGIVRRYMTTRDLGRARSAARRQPMRAGTGNLDLLLVAGAAPQPGGHRRDRRGGDRQHLHLVGQSLPRPRRASARLYARGRRGEHRPARADQGSPEGAGAPRRPPRTRARRSPGSPAVGRWTRSTRARSSGSPIEIRPV